MNDFDISSYHMWQPDFHLALNHAIRQKNQVNIFSNMALDDCNNADIELTGRFIGFSGSLLQFISRDFYPEYGNAYPAAPECEYSFKANIPLPNAGCMFMEYGGRAYIVDSELQKNNIPESLLLRLSPPTRARRLRRHERIATPQGLFLMPGLLLIDHEPVNRRRLLALLGHYYKQKNRSRPTLVDISAGGACLRTNDTWCQRFMGAEESYLFFFFSENDGLLNSPSVFMAKKVGILRDGDSSRAGLRIRFLRELIWTAPNEELKWKNIEMDGSETIKRMFDEWNKLLEKKNDNDQEKISGQK